MRNLRKMLMWKNGVFKCVQINSDKVSCKRVNGRKTVHPAAAIKGLYLSAAADTHTHTKKMVIVCLGFCGTEYIT